MGVKHLACGVVYFCCGICLFGQSATLAMSVAGDLKIPAFDVYRTDKSIRARTWSGGALLAVEKTLGPNPLIHVFDTEGYDTPTTFSIADAAVINVRSVARSEDKTLAAAGFATDASGRRAGFISWITPDRQSATTIRTGYYYPESVVFAPDGTLWSAGTEGFDVEMRKPKMAGAVFRHFDKSGRLLDSLVSWGSMDQAWRMLVPSSLMYMPSSSTRFGWMGAIGSTGGGSAYYEISFATREVTVFPAVPLHGYENVLGFALTEKNDVIASTSVSGPNGPLPQGFYLYKLNRQTRQWDPVELPACAGPQTQKWIVGAHGNTILFRTKDGNHRLLSLV